MPLQSKAQARAMRSAAAGKSTIGIPAAVGARFLADSHGQKLSGLPEHVKKAKGGAVDECRRYVATSAPAPRQFKW